MTSAFCCTGQQSDERPVPNESLSTEMQSAHRAERYQRSDNGETGAFPKLNFFFFFIGSGGINYLIILIFM